MSITTTNERLAFFLNRKAVGSALATIVTLVSRDAHSRKTAVNIIEATCLAGLTDLADCAEENLAAAQDCPTMDATEIRAHEDALFLIEHAAAFKKGEVSR